MRSGPFLRVHRARRAHHVHLAAASAAEAMLRDEAGRVTRTIDPARADHRNARSIHAAGADDRMTEAVAQAVTEAAEAFAVTQATIAEAAVAPAAIAVSAITEAAIPMTMMPTRTAEVRVRPAIAVLDGRRGLFLRRAHDRRVVGGALVHDVHRRGLVAR